MSTICCTVCAHAIATKEMQIRNLYILMQDFETFSVECNQFLYFFVHLLPIRAFFIKKNSTFFNCISASVCSSVHYNQIPCKLIIYILSIFYIFLRYMLNFTKTINNCFPGPVISLSHKLDLPKQ